MILVLIYGNTFVESGIPINKNILNEDMSKSGLVVQRILYDGVINNGGPFEVEVDCKLMKYANNDHGQCICKPERKRELQTVFEKRKVERRKLTNDI